MLWRGGFPYIQGCCGGVGVPYIHYYYYYLFPSPWRKCNATGAEDDDDDEEDVGGVDGDDGGMIYYYCDYYSHYRCKPQGHRSRK